MNSIAAVAVPMPPHGIPTGGDSGSVALTYAIGSAVLVVLFLGVLVTTFPPLRGRLVALWKMRRRDHPMRGVVSFRDRYALQRTMEQMLMEPRWRRQPTQPTPASRRSVLHVRLGGDVVHVEHTDGLVLRLVGVADAIARRLAEAVARHRVELLDRHGSDVVFQVSRYDADGGDGGEILRVRAREVVVDDCV